MPDRSAPRTPAPPTPATPAPATHTTAASAAPARVIAAAQTQLEPPPVRRHDPSRPLTADDVAAGFVAAFEPIPVSPMYRLGLTVVAVVMLLMPLLYVGLIVLAGYGMYWHATANLPRTGPRGDGFGWVLLYGLGLFAGGTLVLAMLKPLLAPRGVGAEPYTVQPDAEPLFTKYVHMVCRAMQAPIPSRIDVDAQANASASYRRGMLSLFGSDLVLTIGLPLVASMNLRELTGVLAHELGHFRQGAAMRLTYIVNRVNWWFARAVYEPDAWDFRLAHAAATQPSMRVPVLFVQLVVWLGRQVLKGIMYLAHAVSCFMSRQMEYDADQCEAQMAGSEAFASVSRQIVRLGAASALAHDQMYRRWTERQLPDNLPDFIAFRAGKLPKELEEEVQKEIDRRQVKLFETHPPIARRIEAAEALKLPGNFQLEAPARAVFNEFNALCTQATYIHYRAIVGRDIMQVTFVPTEQIIGQQKTEDASSDAIERFFPVPLHAVRPIFPGVLEIKPPRNPKEALQDLQDARAELEYRCSELKEPSARFIKAADRLEGLKIARELVYAGLKVRDPSLGLPKISKETVRAELPGAEQARDSHQEALNPAVDAARKRIISALAMLYVPGVDKRLPEAGEYRTRIPLLLDAMIGLKEAYSITRRMRERMGALMSLMDNYRGHERDDLYLKRVYEVGGDLHRHQQEMYSATSSAEYPFGNKRGSGKIVDMLRTGVPADESVPIELINNAMQILDSYFSIYYRTLAELVLMAEKVEQTLKLPPLKLAKMEAEELLGVRAKKKDKSKKKDKKDKSKAEEEKEAGQPIPV